MREHGEDIMKKLSVAALCAALGVSACATGPQPKETLLRLNMSDPLYTSAGCMQARQAALAYNDNVAGRAGVGLALGLLGPIGLLGAVAMDANQGQERDRMNAIVMRECQTQPQ